MAHVSSRKIKINTKGYFKMGNNSTNYLLVNQIKTSNPKKQKRFALTAYDSNNNLIIFQTTPEPTGSGAGLLAVSMPTIRKIYQDWKSFKTSDTPTDKIIEGDGRKIFLYFSVVDYFVVYKLNVLGSKDKTPVWDFRTEDKPKKLTVSKTQ
jgi:hypothetical protein